MFDPNVRNWHLPEFEPFLCAVFADGRPNTRQVISAMLANIFVLFQAVMLGGSGPGE